MNDKSLGVQLFVVSEVDVELLASVTGESCGDVLRKGLESYFSTQLRECSARIKELRNEYQVDSLSALEEQVESGSVDEHPAWEAVIEWRNLEKRIQTLKQF